MFRERFYIDQPERFLALRLDENMASVTIPVMDVSIERAWDRYRGFNVHISSPFAQEVNKAISGVISAALEEWEPSREELSRNTRGRLPDDIRRYITDINQGLGRASHRNFDINQMAKDNCWPLFFHTLRAPPSRSGMEFQDVHYSRDTAKADIEHFKGAHQLTTADWKWFNKQTPVFLFDYFRIVNAGWYPVRWPQYLFVALEDARDFFFDRDGALNFLKPWFKKYFDQPDAPVIQHRQFQDFIRDVIDMNMMGQLDDANKANITGASTFQTLKARAHDIHNMTGAGRGSSAHLRRVEGNLRTVQDEMRRARSEEEYRHLSQRRDMLLREREHIRQMEMMMAIPPMYMGMDLAAGMDIHAMAYVAGRTGRFHMGGGQRDWNAGHKKPKSKKLDWLSQYPAEISHGDFTARLIDDPAKVYDESDKMKHCLFNSYRERIESGKYIAYHIDAPQLKSDGFTLGITKKDTTYGIGLYEELCMQPGAINYVATDAYAPPNTLERSDARIASPRRGGFRSLIPQRRSERERAAEADAARRPKKPAEQPTQWKFDQCRGKRNETPSDTELDRFCKFVVGQVQAAVNKPQQEKAHESQRQ